MAGLVPAIHVFDPWLEIVDARHKAGHDDSIFQVVTPVPIGQDTPVPPSPQ